MTNVFQPTIVPPVDHSPKTAYRTAKNKLRTTRIKTYASNAGFVLACAAICATTYAVLHNKDATTSSD